MPFYKDYNVDTGFVDANKRLSLSKLFLMFQEVAEAHADTLDIGKAQTTDKGRKWIITRYSVKFNKLPNYGDKVRMYTYPLKNNPFFFYRNFYLEDEKGELLVIASSVWAVLDASTNKIVANPFGKLLPEENMDFELPAPIKIEEDAINGVKTHHVEYSDIDLNGHLNNTRYIELIQNLHDSNFYKEYVFDTFVVNYFSEIKEKEDVTLYLDKVDNKEVIKGAVGSRDCFKAIITYK